jgi:hypothetical protein
MTTSIPPYVFGGVGHRQRRDQSNAHLRTPCRRNYRGVRGSRLRRSPTRVGRRRECRWLDRRRTVQLDVPRPLAGWASEVLLFAVEQRLQPTCIAARAVLWNRKHRFEVEVQLFVTCPVDAEVSGPGRAEGPRPSSQFSSDRHQLQRDVRSQYRASHLVSPIPIEALHQPRAIRSAFSAAATSRMCSPATPPHDSSRTPAARSGGRGLRPACARRGSSVAARSTCWQAKIGSVDPWNRAKPRSELTTTCVRWRRERITRFLRMPRPAGCGVRSDTISVPAQLTTHVVSLGGPAHVIAEAAESVSADLIVVGSRGHSPLAQVVMGSVPVRLLQIATYPVLAVPPPER